MQSIAETVLSDASPSVALDSPERQQTLGLGEEVPTATHQHLWNATGIGIDVDQRGFAQQSGGRRSFQVQGGSVANALPDGNALEEVEQDSHSGFDQAVLQFPSSEQSDVAESAHDLAVASQDLLLNKDSSPLPEVQSDTTDGGSVEGLRSSGQPVAMLSAEIGFSPRDASVRTTVVAYGTEDPKSGAISEETAAPLLDITISAEDGTEGEDDRAARVDFATELSGGLKSIAPESVGRWLLSLRGPGSELPRRASVGTKDLEAYPKGDKNTGSAPGPALSLKLGIEHARLPAHGTGASRKAPNNIRDQGDKLPRRLQFANKKTLVDQATPARFEFVDNDHGMQFVNWRTFNGERVMERFWQNSVNESEVRDQQRFEQEIQSKFAQEFEFERRKQLLWQAMGREPPHGETSEEELAAQYYAAMQAALHGPKEDIITGQAFGRYIPSTAQSPITDVRNKVIYGPWALNWNRAITSRTTRVSLGGRRGAVSIGSSASSYVTTANVNWNRTAVTFAARPNDAAVKLGILRGRYGVDVARSNRLRTSAVETVMRYVETATVIDQINRTYGQRVRVRRFSFNYTRDFTIPRFDSPGRTPGLRQELAVNWGSLGISVGTDVPDNEYAISVGLRGYQFSVLRDFFQRLTQIQGNWGRGWQLEIATKFEDPINDLLYYQVGFGRLGRLYATAGAGFSSDSTPMALVQVQGNDASVAFKAVQEAGVRVFNIGFTVGRFTYSWDSVVEYDRVALPLSPISAVLKTLLNITP
ncbi:conserved hypothetical protein [Neospora caninum Liverpool]|nr:conserved hypothetical protein [Neospora caninum Liverpool]CBZ51472.1 conserved hypothetical protein [Neospora caninum Liverpool]|eukprot:XP_003881505.1 conserved hypothetical protein [Neospora caninum Liverpool]